ncbi:MAG: hypothetical protein A3G75_02030 [Verrucomicrobia bacterium RIFCSPLOWO2_12_FULL_64_8]|nr:MAG: hypothetical protein A3G75_02030 [Verrucomicrobia bacterium RIFCSPLOWO2_12_FULL_64_8]
MQSFLRSLLRIFIAVATVLIAVVVGFGWVARQPNVGQLPFPEGSRADGGVLAAHVRFLASTEPPRSWSNAAGLERASEYIAGVFSKTHAQCSRQHYQARAAHTNNLIAHFGPATGTLIVVGAHYDVFGNLPGADDNASGVAGLLELARLLDTRHLASPVELVAYSTEEPPFFGGPDMGSAVHAASLVTAGVRVHAMITLEMIGYFSPSQPNRAFLLHLVYPHAGDFVAIVGRRSERQLVRSAKNCFRGASDLPVVSYSGPAVIGTDLSDHRNYWAVGYPAFMVTDTAYLRNPNYHTANDLPSSLDYQRMAKVVDGVLSTVVHLAND